MMKALKAILILMLYFALGYGVVIGVLIVFAVMWGSSR